MAQVTVNLPSIKNWRTTIFGILTAIGGALFEQFQTGELRWQVAVACSLWAIFCYLVPDAKENTKSQAQLTALLDALSGMKPTIPSPVVTARTDAPATDPVGDPTL